MIGGKSDEEKFADGNVTFVRSSIDTLTYSEIIAIVAFEKITELLSSIVYLLLILIRSGICIIMLSKNNK